MYVVYCFNQFLLSNLSYKRYNQYLNKTCFEAYVQESDVEKVTTSSSQAETEIEKKMQTVR